jgi:hypothetical protein
MDRRSPAATLSSDLVPTIFHEPWWMSIVSDGRNREVVATRGGKLIGRLPFIASRKWRCMTSIGMPRLSHVLGPALAPDAGLTSTLHPKRHIALIHELVAQMPAASHISFRLHGAFSNTLAFDMLGFTNSADYTVIIEPDAVATMWRNMRDKTRNVIRRAQDQLIVRDTVGATEFQNFYELNLRDRGVRNLHNPAASEQIIQECLRRGVGKIWVATSADGAFQAAIVTVWDRRAAYYFLSTRRAGSANGAISLLIWTAMQHSASKRLKFDMDGLHVGAGAIKNLYLLTGFGGLIKPRFVVRKSAVWVNIMRIGRDLVRTM